VSTKRRSGGRAHRPLLTPGHSECLAVEGNLSEKVVAATFAPGSVASEPLHSLIITISCPATGKRHLPALPQSSDWASAGLLAFLLALGSA